MKQLKFGLAALLLLLSYSSLSLATTVVAVRTQTAIVIGADSKLRTVEAPGIWPSSCKIKVTNNVAFANAGLLGNSVTKFALDDEAKQFMTMKGPLIERVQLFQSSVILKLGKTISRLKINSPRYFAEEIDGKNVTQIIFAAEDRGNLRLLVREFASLKGTGGQVSVRAKDVQSNDAGAIALGRTDAIEKAIKHPPPTFANSLEDRVKYLIQLEIDHQPQYVGPPISLLRVERGKIEWKERGLCKE